MLVRPRLVGVGRYDVTERDSFDNIKHWVKQIRENADARVRLVLVGNKSDRDAARTVSEDEGSTLAREFGVAFYETSARDGVGVDACFEKLARETKDALLAAEPDAEPAGVSSPRGITLDGVDGPARGRRRCC